jgi:hypothetical protein
MMTGRQPADVGMIDRKVTRVGFGHLSSFLLERSTATPMIQAADVLAATITEYAFKSVARDPTKARLRAVVLQILRLALGEDPNATLLALSDSAMKRLFEGFRV